MNAVTCPGSGFLAMIRHRGSRVQSRIAAQSQKSNTSANRTAYVRVASRADQPGSTHPVVQSPQMQAAHTLDRTPAPPDAPPKPSEQQRYVALDAYRGFIMMILVSGGFGLAELAARRPAFTGLATQFEHMPWEWIAFWDLIQPAFMFMVGVAMPFALARRMEQGATERQLFWHVAARSFRLILMSQILISISAGRLSFQLINVLAQIGITYFLCYLIMQLRSRWQAMISGLILMGHWALFVVFPGTEGPFLSKTTNIGAVVDKFLFGRVNPG